MAVNELVQSLRSVEIGVPDVPAVEDFFTRTWGLRVSDRDGAAVYLRGTGADHHLIALHPSAVTALRAVVFRCASAEAIDQICERVPLHGGTLLHARERLAAPGGGESALLRDPQGRILRLVCGDARHADTQGHRDQPVRLAHAVLNSHDVAEGLAFYEQVLGFALADRTRIMAFVRIPRAVPFDHHSIALADADNDCLNHIAFVMPDIDSVMRGGGRMRDAGHPIEWGPGRHGPGDNAFNYFIGPAGLVIEYTAEVEQVSPAHVAKGPDDWKWPPGRVDQWGISAPPSAALKQAQRAIGFIDPQTESIS